MNLFTVAFLFLATALVALAKPIASNCPATPDLPVEDLPSVTALHDPFTFLNGQKVVTKDDWACRREEILDLVQKYEFGTLPPKATILSAVVDWYNFSRAVDITVGHEGKEFNFTSFFTLPIEPTVEAHTHYSSPLPPMPPHSASTSTTTSFTPTSITAVHASATSLRRFMVEITACPRPANAPGLLASLSTRYSSYRWKRSRSTSPALVSADVAGTRASEFYIR
ncbi:hypothetical protein CC1G_05747 [Coprinopsis cinerea okayama7|uniref:Uncharacterized protein n=1 Tax=Coprinopsis cinerea (strain Okayama-7 / 130 / ATCC MYA-4618 / FGSC 9003) TaxID=240176 RepID=A8NA20_COPC7|nr:hypothetical protein CC1G_05747 [Coprinopsis cinerea okayama7\|eukprot:XP_001831676.1 hypothetical protein CC1G_05747 [Coprinopsis cinerea okayama7\